MEDRREIQQVQYNISNTSYAASAHLTPAEQRAWWQDDEPAESSALMMALHGEATCSPPSSQYMGLAGWNQMGTATAHDVLHLSSDGSQLQLQGSM